MRRRWTGAAKDHFFRGAFEPPVTRVADLAHCRLTRPVVLVNGGLDILHAGHLKVLAVARAKAGPAGTVVVALDSDRKVEAAKGAGRPVLSWIERATALGFTGVDWIIEVDTDEDMREVMEGLRPDLRVQGSEYREHPTRFPEVPRCFVTRRGMSTSEIVRRVLAGGEGR